MPVCSSPSLEGQLGAPSRFEDVAGKMVLPALLNVNGSNYSHVTATACPLVTYPDAVDSTPEHVSLLVVEGHSSSYLCEH